MATITLEIPSLPEFAPQVRELVEAVFQAHQRAAKDNSNVSSVTAQHAYAGSRNFTGSVAAAMLTTGGPHAPVAEARSVLRSFTEADVLSTVEKGGKVAGFGNSFFKIETDPAWVPVRDLVHAKFPERYKRLDELTIWLHKCGKPVLPNAAIYTAVACEEAGVPDGFEALFFMLPRIPVWAELCQTTR